MKMSELLGRRVKEAPRDAQLVSHQILLRGGYIRQVGAGLFSLLPAGLRVARKVEAIIRQEMDAVGGQEVLMPVVLPRELWEESGRYSAVGSELLRFKDRTGKDLVLGMTHEEAVVHLARGEVMSWRQLPFTLYQIQTKFRDEPRSRGGLIRVREFTMKDAYSFHRDPASLLETYERLQAAYERIFRRTGLVNFISVASDTGMMGGGAAHEFMLLSPAGEDSLMVCGNCNYRANLEVARAHLTAQSAGRARAIEKVATPGAATIEAVAGLLGRNPEGTCKAVLLEVAGQLVLVLLRGERELNEAKLRKLLKTAQFRMAGDELITRAGMVPGYASPLGTKTGTYKLIADESLRGEEDLVAGANETGYHVVGFHPGRDLAGLDFAWADVACARAGDPCPECGAPLELKRGIEIGNIFQLGDKYSRAMGMKYLDEQGREQVPIMGCYGIGVGRLVAAAVEEHHDANGPIWPEAIAPFAVHVNILDANKPGVLEAGMRLYGELMAAGVETLVDDRGEKPGFQFTDADLLGVPHRLVMSPRNLAAGKVEYRRRAGGEARQLDLASAVSEVRAQLMSK